MRAPCVLPPQACSPHASEHPPGRRQQQQQEPKLGGAGTEASKDRQAGKEQQARETREGNSSRGRGVSLGLGGLWGLAGASVCVLPSGSISSSCPMQARACVHACGCVSGAG
eukprot:1152021-Pelagomonas_calceolata.AAC.5